MMLTRSVLRTIVLAGTCLSLATATLASESGVTIYRAGRPVDDANFVDLTPLMAQLGGTVLSGNPTIKARFDGISADGTEAHGIFEQIGQATIQIVFPFDEHIQVLHGVLKVTDANGTSTILTPGDSYFIGQGSVILWETLTPVFQKSFFNLVRH